MPAKLEKCVTDVKAKGGKGAKNPFAICTASLQKSGYLKPGTQKVKRK